MKTRWMTWIEDEAATVELEREGARVTARIESAAGVRELVFDVGREAANGEHTLRVGGGGTLGAWVGGAVRGEREVHVGSAVAGVRYGVRVRSEVDALAMSGEDGHGSGAVSVAMPGRVVKVLAQVGQAVTKGMPLLIIEAMKMENEIKARRDGVVRVVHVREGASVEGGALLMEIGD